MTLERLKWYVLDENKTPVPADDLIAWAEWFEGGDDKRRVGYDQIGLVTVSTVFIGRDLSYGGGPALLFETMTFPEEEQRRYSTWAEAEIGHAEAVAAVRAAQPEQAT